MDDVFKNPLGWEALEPRPNANQDVFDTLNKQAYDLCHLHAKVFGTKEGKQLLAWLKEQTIESATWMSSLPYQEGIAHGFAREGQNALVRGIMDRIELARTCKDVNEFAARLANKQR